jgi:hypothetical protein
MFLKSIANCSVDVCSFHFIALMLYSYMFSPSNHLHLIFSLHGLYYVAAEVDVYYGGCGAGGCGGSVDVVDIGTVAGGVSWIRFSGVVVGAVIGKWVVSRS